MSVVWHFVGFDSWSWLTWLLLVIMFPPESMVKLGLVFIMINERSTMWKWVSIIRFIVVVAAIVWGFFSVSNM